MKKHVFNPFILDLQRMDPVTGTWAEIGLLKEARYSLLSLFEIDHYFLLKETMFFLWDLENKRNLMLLQTPKLLWYHNIERALLRNPGCPWTRRKGIFKNWLLLFKSTSSNITDLKIKKKYLSFQVSLTHPAFIPLDLRILWWLELSKELDITLVPFCLYRNFLQWPCW